MQTNEQPRKRTLLDIVEDFRQLMLTIGDNDGELTDALMLDLDECEAEFSQKVDRVLFVAEEFFGSAEAYKRRAKALTEHSKALENKGQRLREYVHAAMAQLNIQKLSTETFPSIYRRVNIGTRILNEEKFLELYGEDEALVVWVPKIYLEPVKKILKGIPEGEPHPMKTVAALVGSESLIVK
jgi:hypothetical protein